MLQIIGYHIHNGDRSKLYPYEKIIHESELDQLRESLYELHGFNEPKDKREHFIYFDKKQI